VPEKQEEAAFESGHAQVPTFPLQLLYPCGQPDERSRNRQEWTKELHIQNDILGCLHCLVHYPNTSEKLECFCLMYAQHYYQLIKNISQIMTFLSNTTDRA
jgi:hypothetical protein